MLFFRSQKESKARVEFPAIDGFIAGTARKLDNEKLRGLVGVYKTEKGNVEIKDLRSVGEEYRGQILHQKKIVGTLSVEISDSGGMIIELSPNFCVGSVVGSGDISKVLKAFCLYL